MEPFIWLQEDETEGRADCGCSLSLERPRTGSGPAVFLCQTHAAAFDLLAACEALTQSLRTFRNVPKDEQDFVTFDEEALAAGFAAIAKAKGED